MNIGIVVDGDAEFASLPNLYAQLRAATNHAFMNPLKADIQPLAPIGAIAERCEKPCRQLVLRGADRVVILIDHEGRSECPGALAAEISQRLGLSAVAIVLKSTMFENWLVADIDAMAASEARFEVSRATRRAIQPNKADNVDAVMLIKRSIKKGSYSKVADAKRILGRADVERMGAHSRSFRRMLRCADHPGYRAQSRLPSS